MVMRVGQPAAVALALTAAAVFLSAQSGASPELYRRLLSAGLDAVTRAAGEPRERLLVAANLFLAHEAVVAAVPTETLKKAVDAFKDAGLGRIDINMGLFPWLDGERDTIARYDAVVDHIRRAGLQLAINPQYSPVRHRVGSIGEWQRQASKVYREIAGRYKPDVFVVVHEPSTMAQRMRAKISPEEWAGFVRETSRVVKQQSPRSRIGAGGLHTEREYFETFAAMREVDVLTLDVYALRALPAFERMIETARRHRKPVYIEETWRPPYVERGDRGGSLDAIFMKNVGSREFEELDGEWLRALAAWASSKELEAVTYFWMQTFFAYMDQAAALEPAYIREVVRAIDGGERTDTYRTLRDVAREYSGR